MNIRQMIKIELAKKDMTQSDLAALMGETRQAMSKKLSRNDFKISTLEKIANALGKDISLSFVEKDTEKE